MMTSEHKQLAHFFWHGKLEAFEQANIKSFIKAGFEVYVWSYTNLQVDGATSKDASEIFPKENLSIYTHYFPDFNDRDQTHGTLAAFSDAFRYNVINKYPGWWFDADCYCLKPAKEFIKLTENKTIIAALEYKHALSCQALWADASGRAMILSELDYVNTTTNYKLKRWGQTGPHLILNAFLKNNLEEQILPMDVFLALSWNEDMWYVDPTKVKQCKQYIKDSYVTHIWTSRWEKNGIDKNNPPIGSLMYEFISGSYTNDEQQDLQIKEFSLNRLNKFKQISKLYKEILKREADYEGIDHYMESSLDVNQIGRILQRSDEARDVNKKIRKIHIY